MNRKHFLLIFVAALLAHSAGLFCDFTNWDDNLYVTENPRTQSLSFKNVVDIFNPALTPSDPFPEYQPVRDLSLAFNWAVWNGKAIGFHVMNILCHGINAMLVYIFVMTFFSSLPVALFTALLFGVHPVHVESVAWISSRKDVLALLYSLLSSIAFWKGEEKKSTKLWVLSLLALLFALLSKSQAVTFPIILLGFCIWKKRDSISRLIPHFLLVLAYVFHFLNMQFERTAVTSYYDLGYEPNGAAILQTFSRYIWKLFVPVGLSPYYDLNYELKKLNLMLLLSVFTFLLFFGLIYYFWKREKRISLSLLFFFVQLLPVLNFLPHPIWIADRYLYFGAFFIFLGLGIHFEKYLIQPNMKWFAGLLIVLGIMTFQYTLTWRSSKTLWEAVLQKYPHAYPAELNLPDVYLKEENVEGAEKLLIKALKARPKDAGLLINMGTVKHHVKDYEGALHFYNLALQTDPRSKKGVFNRARALHALHRYDEASSAYQFCIEIDTNADPCYSGLGNILAKKGKLDLAFKALSIAVGINPKNVDAYYDLGVLEAKRNHMDEAKANLRKVLELKPDFPNAKEIGALISK